MPEGTRAAPAPAGIGGWLILPALGALLLPLLHANAAVEAAQALVNVQENLPIAYLSIILWLHVMLCMGWFAALFLLWKRDARFPQVSMGLVLASIVLVLVMTYLSPMLLGTEPEPGEIRILVLVAAMFWIHYMQRSRRVKNTFVK